MKLRNKKTGEINEFKSIDLYEGYGIKLSSESLAKLNEDWEDYEEPKEYYWIDYDGKVKSFVDLYEWQDKMKQIGNYFETKEEAERAVEKLKAWKRLKDNGVSFEVKVIDKKWYLEPKSEPKERAFSEVHDLFKDIMLVFGGEE